MSVSLAKRMTQFARNLPNHLKQNDAKKIILRIEVRNPKTFKELIHQADEEIQKILKRKESQKILSAVFNLCKQTISAYLKPGKPGFWRERLSDGEKGLTGNVIKKFCSDNNISLYFNSSPFRQHNRVVDRVIRTIRDGLERIETQQLIII
ncbi:MAG: hypothetical protein EZS28_019370 [Streblomastix strix]|uniref:Integrase catalytic domain-containing protein n=1 Tax=Streblomastix strix TaxID=222440 RepID=A0A5J4VS09_9EUKA|nr:MAG: hypothetical protein EZS28_019370 [Streblomastix strix]